MNAFCKLCGFRVDSSRAEGSRCPVCGQEYATDCSGDSAGAAGPDDTTGQGGLSSHIMQSAGIDNAGWDAASSIGGTAKIPSLLNPELESLLCRLPRKSDMQRRDDAVLRIAGVLFDREEESDVVHIRPRVDPTMRVLKERYKTQLGVKKAASMNALHRLADPLTGHDSMQALDPEARKRRQENVQRILHTGRSEGQLHADGYSKQRVPRSKNSGGLLRSSITSTQRRSVAGSGKNSASVSRTPLSISVDAVHAQLQVAATENASKRGWGRQKLSTDTSSDRNGLRIPRGSARRSRESSAAPREKVNLRRKRVATMRSVNGWVGELNRGSPTPQHVPREKRMTWSRERATVDRVPSEAGNATSGSSLGGSKRRSRDHRTRGDRTFLTALDANVTPRKTVDGARRGGRETGVRGTRDNDGRGYCRDTNSDNVKLWGADGRVTTVCKKRGRKGVQEAAHNERTSLNVTTGRVRAGRGRAGSRTTLGSVRGKVGLGRTWGSKSTGAMRQRYPAGLSWFKTRGASPADACSKQYSRRRTSSYNGANAGPVVIENSKHQASGLDLEEQHIQESRDESDNILFDDPLHMQGLDPEKAKGVAVVRKSAGTQVSMLVTSPAMPPAWEVQDPNPVPSPFTGYDILSVSLRDDSITRERPEQPLSAWQHLRGVGDVGRSAAMLRTFEDKVDRTAEAMTDQRMNDQPDEALHRNGDWQDQQRLSCSREEEAVTSITTPITNAEQQMSTKVPSLFSSWSIDDSHDPDSPLRWCVRSIPTDYVAAAKILTTPSKFATKTNRQGKNRPPLQCNDQFTGKMQRLNTAPKTVGHAWGKGGGCIPSLRTPKDADRPADSYLIPLRSSSGQSPNAGQLQYPDQLPPARQSHDADRLSTAGQSSATGQSCRLSVPDRVDFPTKNVCRQQLCPTTGANGKGVGCSVGSRRRMLLLSSANSRHLLCVGSPDRFKFRMSMC